MRRRRIAVDDHEVGLLAGGDRSDRARRGPRYFAPFSVPIVIASSGVKPASTSSSICRWLRVAGDDAAAAGRIGAGDEQCRPLARTRARAPSPSGTASRRSTVLFCARALRSSARTARCSCGVSTSSPGGIGRPGVNVSNTVSVDVSATLLVDELLHERLERRAVLVERGDGLLPRAWPGQTSGCLSARNRWRRRSRARGCRCRGRRLRRR